MGNMEKWREISKYPFALRRALINTSDASFEANDMRALSKRAFDLLVKNNFVDVDRATGKWVFTNKGTAFRQMLLDVEALRKSGEFYVPCLEEDHPKPLTLSALVKLVIESPHHKTAVAYAMQEEVFVGGYFGFRVKPSVSAELRTEYQRNGMAGCEISMPFSRAYLSWPTGYASDNRGKVLPLFVELEKEPYAVRYKIPDNEAQYMLTGKLDKRYRVCVNAQYYETCLAFLDDFSASRPFDIFLLRRGAYAGAIRFFDQETNTFIGVLMPLRVDDNTGFISNAAVRDFDTWEVESLLRFDLIPVGEIEAEEEGDKP